MHAKRAYRLAPLGMALWWSTSSAYAEPGRTGQFEIGAGYATDDGFVARAAISQTNLFGTGIGLALDAAISERVQELALRIHDPYVLDTENSLDVALFHQLRHNAAFDRQATGAELLVGIPIREHLRGILGYRIERVNVTGLSAVIPRQLGRAIEPGTPRSAASADYMLGTATAGLEYSSIQSPLYPTRGSALGASIELSDRMFGSTEEMVKGHLWAETHHRVGPFIAHLSAKVDAVNGGPMTERLQFDGSSMVRGWGPGTLGPHDAYSGVALGSTFDAYGRAQLELPISTKYGLSIVGFVDAGVFSGPEDSTGSLSAGFGILWKSPIGPIEIDYAIPVNGRGGPVFTLGRF